MNKVDIKSCSPNLVGAHVPDHATSAALELEVLLELWLLPTRGSRDALSDLLLVVADAPDLLLPPPLLLFDLLLLHLVCHIANKNIYTIYTIKYKIEMKFLILICNFL